MIIPGGWLQPRGLAPSRWFRRRRTLDEGHMEASEVVGVPQIIHVMDGHDLVLKHIEPMVTWGFPMLRNPDIRNMMIIFIGIAGTRGIPHFPTDAHDSTMVPMKSWYIGGRKWPIGMHKLLWVVPPTNCASNRTQESAEHRPCPVETDEAVGVLTALRSSYLGIISMCSWLIHARLIPPGPS